MSVLPKVGSAAVVIAIGAGLWAVGQFQGRHAATRRAFLMMRYGAAADEYEASGPGRQFWPARWRDDLRTREAASRYWLRQYDRLGSSQQQPSATGPSASYLMLVANAGYREVAGALTDATPIERFDGIARLYLDVLQHDANLIDAAYNYEFVIRRKNAVLRERAARRRTGAQGRAGPEPATSLHGSAGAAPPEPDTDDFKILVPQRPEERRRQPEAGAGGGKARKG
jgi:hypothetical protein